MLLKMRFSLKTLFSLMITLLIFGTVFITLVSYVFKNSDGKPVGPLRTPPALPLLHSSKRCDGCSDGKPVGPLRTPPALPLLHSKRCDGCSESLIEKILARYSQTWKKQQENSTKFRALLRSTCHGFTKAIVSQNNTLVGAKIVYDGEKIKPLDVTSAIFHTFAKRNPFSNKTWDTCSVVGNGGILLNSTCGEMIDSAQFVIRCNLPPLDNGFLKDVGNKTDLVTANPSILNEKFQGLQERRRPFMESMRHYNDALMLLPAFSYSRNLPLSLRALYTIEDFKSPIRPVFFNPEYIQSLARFWSSKGLRSMRLSTGFMVASLALELCTNVHLYGFWPFDQHPHFHQPLNNHYYDNRQSKKAVHAMPAEFDHLLRLHEQGILKIHLGECRSSSR